MFDRVVSLASLMLAAGLEVLFVICTWWALSGHGIADHILTIAGWTAAAKVLHRYATSTWLDPVSIVKR